MEYNVKTNNTLFGRAADALHELRIHLHRVLGTAHLQRMTDLIRCRSRRQQARMHAELMRRAGRT